MPGVKAGYRGAGTRSVPPIQPAPLLRRPTALPPCRPAALALVPLRYRRPTAALASRGAAVSEGCPIIYPTVPPLYSRISVLGPAARSLCHRSRATVFHPQSPSPLAARLLRRPTHAPAHPLAPCVSLTYAFAALTRRACRPPRLSSYESVTLRTRRPSSSSPTKPCGLVQRSRLTSPSCRSRAAFV